MPRIHSLATTVERIIAAVAEGNIGAIDVLTRMMLQNEKIDPDSVLGPLGGIMFLDTLGIYGSRVWMLYKDVCGESILKMIAVLRAVQLGCYQASLLDKAIDRPGKYDVSRLADDALAAVREKLPNFGKEVADGRAL